MKNKLAILGNGTSRRYLVDEIKSFDEVWVCNKGLYEHTLFPNIKRAYSVHQDILQTLATELSAVDHDITLVGPPGAPYGDIFKEPRGWSSGSQAVLDALLEGYEKIYLYGFDFGGDDLYQSHFLEGGNFRKQYRAILADERFNASERLILRYPDKYEDPKILPIAKEDGKYLMIDIGDSTPTEEELDEIIFRLERNGGSLYGKGISYQRDSVMGYLIQRLVKAPLTSERDDQWLFYFDSGFGNYFYQTPCDESKFENYVKNKKIIFVGPSPNLIGRNLGEFIDSFDLVIRSNNMINILIMNPDLAVDYGTKAEVLYTNITYERDSRHEWRMDEWRARGLKFLVRKLKKRDDTKPFIVPWRQLRRNGLEAINYSLGVCLIHDLLSFPIESLHVLGIDGYHQMPELIDENNDEYLPGYLPEHHINYRANHFGKIRSTHDKFIDSARILKFAREDHRLILDEDVEKGLKGVLNECKK